MMGHYIATAFRHFRRHQITTSMKVLCLTLGLICFAMSYGVYSYYQQRDRHFPSSDRIHVVGQTYYLSDTGTSARIGTLPWKAAPLLKADFPEIEIAARAGGQISVLAEVDSQRMPVKLSGADADFLRVFPLRFIAGIRSTALDGPRSAVISEAAAQRLFGAADPVGRLLPLDGVTVQITGVVRIPTEPSHIDDKSFELLASMEAYRAAYEAQRGPDRARAVFETWQETGGFRTYLMLPQADVLDVHALNKRLSAFVERHIPKSSASITRKFEADHVSQFAIPRLTNIGELVSNISLLLILATIVLTIACLNYATLTAAQTRARLRETGICKAIGAGGRRIVQQQLIEAAIVAILSFLVALIVVSLLIPVARAAVGIDLSAVLSTNPAFWLGMLGTLLAVICLSASYPAMLLARYRPIDALRGSPGATRSNVFSTVLVGLQFATVGFLLIGALVVRVQNEELQRAGLQYAGDPVVVLFNDLRASGVEVNVLRAELERQPFVESVSFSNSAPWSDSISISCCLARLGRPSAGSVVMGKYVSHDYFRTMGMNLLAGNDFDRDRDASAPGEPSKVIIDRETAAAFGWSEPGAAIGELLHAPRSDGGVPAQFRVLGVVEGPQMQAQGPSGAITVYSSSARLASVAHVRLSRSNVVTALERVDGVWSKLAPHSPIERRFLDDLFEENFKQFDRNARIFGALSLGAFAIAIAGLVAMAFHMATHRKREIGIRKTLGASVSRIVFMLLRDFSKPVAIANVIVWPLGFIAAQKYLNLFVHRADLTAEPFIASLAITVLVACAAAGAQSFRAARVRPAEVLRCD